MEPSRTLEEAVQLVDDYEVQRPQHGLRVPGPPDQHGLDGFRRDQDHTAGITSGALLR